MAKLITSIGLLVKVCGILIKIKHPSEVPKIRIFVWKNYMQVHEHLDTGNVIKVALSLKTAFFLSNTLSLIAHYYAFW